MLFRSALRDFEGDIDLIFFAKVWKECRDILSMNEFIALKGSLDPATDRNPQKPCLKVSSIVDIAALSRSAARKLAAEEEPKVPPTGPQPTIPEVIPAKAPAGQIAAPPVQPLAEPWASSASPIRAVHVRLSSEAADRDEGIYPLRDYIAGNPGSCPVFIHIDAKIMRVSTGINPEADMAGCAGVTEVWKE